MFPTLRFDSAKKFYMEFLVLSGWTKDEKGIIRNKDGKKIPLPQRFALQFILQKAREKEITSMTDDEISGLIAEARRMKEQNIKIAPIEQKIAECNVLILGYQEDIKEAVLRLAKVWWNQTKEDQISSEIDFFEEEIVRLEGLIEDFNAEVQKIKSGIKV